MKQKGRKLAHYVVVGSSLLLSGAMQPPLIIGSVRLGTRSNTAKPLLLLKMALNEINMPKGNPVSSPGRL